MNLRSRKPTVGAKTSGGTNALRVEPVSVNSYRHPEATPTLTKLMEVVVPSMSNNKTLAWFMVSVTCSLTLFMV